MTDFVTMQGRITDDLTRSDLANQAKNVINDAIKLWEGTRFAFNEKRYLINTVDAQEYYDLSGSGLLNSDGSVTATGEMVLEIDSITVTVNNAPYPLKERTQQWFDLNASLPALYKGQPDSYGVYGNQLRLFPIPDAVYPVRISCLARLGPNPLSADGDTNAWMTEGEMLIRAQAKVQLADFPLQDDDLMSRAQREIDTALVSLIRKRDAKAATGRTPPSSL